MLQAGKTFLDPSLEKNAAQYNQDPDDTHKLAMTTLAIKSGDSIIFLNRDIVAHNIISNDFDFKVQEKGTDTPPQRFDKPGVYEIHCMIHPKMKLKVIVK